MQELESTNHRLEGEVRRLSESNAMSQSSQEALSSRLEEQERLGKAASRKHDEEVGHLWNPDTLHEASGTATPDSKRNTDTSKALNILFEHL